MSKTSDRYVKVVAWSEEDQCYIGRCPVLMFGGVHGSDERAVYDELCEAVDEWIRLHEAEGRPLPRSTSLREIEALVWFHRWRRATLLVRVAISRFTGQVIGKQIEVVNEWQFAGQHARGGVLTPDFWPTGNSVDSNHACICTFQMFFVRDSGCQVVWENRARWTRPNLELEPIILLISADQEPVVMTVSLAS